MKLAEALIERAEIKKKNANLIERMKDNVKVQEGDLPAEMLEELLPEYEKNMERFILLTHKINETNNKTSFDDKMNIAEIITERDCLGMRIRAYREIHEKATVRQDRYNRQEVKFVRCIDVKELQRQIDILSKEYREIDTKIQGLNWTVDLL